MRRQGHKPRRWVVPIAVLLALTGAVAGFARATGPDPFPPTFAGLKSATTCVPGPADGGQTAGYKLSWDAATDNVTPSTKIRYDVYQATKSGGEDFSSPAYVVRHGATTFTTPPLPAATRFYFVVRAKDRAGNEDANVVERDGVNLCV